MAFLTQNKAKLCKILIITLVFEKIANFSAKNYRKIPEHCDHNIDPRWSILFIYLFICNRVTLFL
jgi:hypothetical protein